MIEARGALTVHHGFTLTHHLGDMPRHDEARGSRELILAQRRTHGVDERGDTQGHGEGRQGDEATHKALLETWLRTGLAQERTQRRQKSPTRPRVSSARPVLPPAAPPAHPESGAMLSSPAEQ